jgi:hypothetical protein
MDVNRRKEALQSYTGIVSSDTEYVKKELEGVEKMVEVYRNRPSFADADTREEVDERMNNVSSEISMK